MKGHFHDLPSHKFGSATQLERCILFNGEERPLLLRIYFGGCDYVAALHLQV
jgi:hypothetical protein